MCTNVVHENNSRCCIGVSTKLHKSLKTRNLIKTNFCVAFANEANIKSHTHTGFD